MDRIYNKTSTIRLNWGYLIIYRLDQTSTKYLLYSST